MVLSSAAICLAANIYFEARNQPVEGQFAVAYVTMNRVKDKNSSVCGEVLRPKQFSWTSDSNILTVFSKKNTKTVAIKTNAYPKAPDDAMAFRRAISIARVVLNPLNSFKDITNGATHFHTKGINPDWKGYVKVASIDDHLFYKRNKDNKI